MVPTAAPCAVVHPHEMADGPKRIDEVMPPPTDAVTTDLRTVLEQWASTDITFPSAHARA